MPRHALLLATAMAVLGAGPSLAQAPPAAPRGAAAFQRMDGNRDGQVTREEYLAALRQRFEAADANRDGGLSPEEFDSFLRAGRGGQAAAAAQPDARRQARFARLDSNRDGRLSFGELQPMLERRFVRLDSNRDGAVTAEEARASRRRPATPPAATPEAPAR